MQPAQSNSEYLLRRTYTITRKPASIQHSTPSGLKTPAAINPWGRSAAPTPRSPSRRAPLPLQAVASPSLRSTSATAFPPSQTTASPRTPMELLCRPCFCGRGCEAHTLGAVCAAVCRPVSTPALHRPRAAIFPVGASLVQLSRAAHPGRPSTARSSHAPGRPTRSIGQPPSECRRTPRTPVELLHRPCIVPARQHAKKVNHHAFAGDNTPPAQDPGGPPRLVALHTLRAALTASIAPPSHIAGMTPCTTPDRKGPHNPRRQNPTLCPFLFPFGAGRQVARSPPPTPLSRITSVIGSARRPCGAAAAPAQTPLPITLRYTE